MVDIKNVSEINRMLRSLKKDTLPIFGSMTAQHMVEHLASSVQLSAGKRLVNVLVSPTQALQNKSFLYSEREFSQGITATKIPVLKELEHSDMNSSIDSLFSGMDHFLTFYKTNESVKPKHPLFGELNYFEWSIFHSKHFTHHFKQFNLI